MKTCPTCNQEIKIDHNALSKEILEDISRLLIKLKDVGGPIPGSYGIDDDHYNQQDRFANSYSENNKGEQLLKPERYSEQFLACFKQYLERVSNSNSALRNAVQTENDYYDSSCGGY